MVDSGTTGTEKHPDWDSDRELQLTWKNHMCVMKRVMQALRHQKAYSDATLVCGGQRYDVHQFILSTCSHYLDTLFKSVSGEHPLLILPDTPPKALEKLLDFMYMGEADMIEEEFFQVLHLADELKVIGLIGPNADAVNQTWKLLSEKDDAVEKAEVIHERENATHASTQVSEDLKENTRKKRKLGCRAVKNVKCEPHSIKMKVNDKNSSVAFVQDDKEVTEAGGSLLMSHACPFQTMSEAVLHKDSLQDIVNRPYMCLYCHERHPKEKLHVAHQKQDHPKKAVIIGKNLVSELRRSGRSMRPPSRLSEFVFSSAPPSPSHAQETFTTQVPTSELPQISEGSADSASNEMVDSESNTTVVKTEDSSPIHEEESEPKVSAVSSLDNYTQETSSKSHTNTSKRVRKHNVSASHNTGSGKRPSVASSCTTRAQKRKCPSPSQSYPTKGSGGRKNHSVNQSSLIQGYGSDKEPSLGKSSLIQGSGSDKEPSLGKSSLIQGSGSDKVLSLGKSSLIQGSGSNKEPSLGKSFCTEGSGSDKESLLWQSSCTQGSSNNSNHSVHQSPGAQENSSDNSSSLCKSSQTGGPGSDKESSLCQSFHTQDSSNSKNHSIHQSPAAEENGSDNDSSLCKSSPTQSSGNSKNPSLSQSPPIQENGSGKGPSLDKSSTQEGDSCKSHSSTSPTVKNPRKKAKSARKKSPRGPVRHLKARKSKVMALEDIHICTAFC